MSRYRTIAVVLVVLLSVVPSVALAEEEVIGSPSIEVFSPNSEFRAGQEVTLDLHLSNEGDVRSGGAAEYQDRVTTARGTTLELRSGNAPISVKTGRTPVGSVPQGTQGPYGFEITIDENAEPGVYRLPVKVKYTYTRMVEYGTNIRPRYHDFTSTETQHVRLRISDTAQFKVVGSESNVLIGDTGNLTVSVKNTGTETAYDAGLTLNSNSDELTFGSGSTSSEAFVGVWEPGQTRDIEYTVTLDDRAKERGYTVKGTVSYEGPDGIPKTSNEVTAGVIPQGEQSFSLRDVRGELRVGEEDTLRGTVVNEGPSEARNAVVVLSTNNPNIIVGDSEYAVPDLDEGGSAEFAFDVDVSDAATAGYQQFEFRMRYRNSEDDTRTSDSIDQRVRIGGKRDIFGIERVSNEVSAGSSSEIRLNITNNANETHSEISAKGFFNSPLSSGDDEAFISELAPGESSEIVLGVSAGGGALEKVYPVSFDFQYQTPDGDTVVSDTYKVPIEVTQSDGGGLPIVPILVIVLLGAGAFVWWRRR